MTTELPFGCTTLGGVSPGLGDVPRGLGGAAPALDGASTVIASDNDPVRPDKPHGLSVVPGRQVNDVAARVDGCDRGR